MNLKELRSKFDIDKKDFSIFVFALSTLEEGESISTILARIKKIDSETFKLEVSEENIQNLISELLYDEPEHRVF